MRINIFMGYRMLIQKWVVIQCLGLPMKYITYHIWLIMIGFPLISQVNKSELHVHAIKIKS
jgi:hypothetical protein